MSNLIIFYPAASFTLACLALVAAVLCIRSPRPIITAGIIFALLPVLPIVMVRCLAVWTIDLCDWLTVGRFWTMPSSAAARWLERHL